MWWYVFQLTSEWVQVEVIDLLNDGSGLGFGIIGGKSTGVVVKTILPGGIADKVSVWPWQTFTVSYWLVII